MTLLTWPVYRQTLLPSSRGPEQRRTLQVYQLPGLNSCKLHAVSPCYPTCTAPSERSYATISPHTTSCRYRPLYSLAVRKPSLPATSSRQSVDISCSIDPASRVCCWSIPNIMHFPMRVWTSESHRGLSAAVAGVSLLEVVDWNRPFRTARRSGGAAG
jgi:hypothetical protein